MHLHTHHTHSHTHLLTHYIHTYSPTHLLTHHTLHTHLITTPFPTRRTVQKTRVSRANDHSRVLPHPRTSCWWVYVYLLSKQWKAIQQQLHQLLQAVRGGNQCVSGSLPDLPERHGVFKESSWSPVPHVDLHAHFVVCVDCCFVFIFYIWWYVNTSISNF